jgi:type IV pilus assembly protein PilC
LQYQFEAIDKRGKSRRGTIEAATRHDAEVSVKNMGMYVVSLTEKKPGLWEKGRGIWIGKPVKHKEFVVFCRQLAVLLEAGTALADALALLAKHAESRPFQQVLEQIGTEVSSGSTFSAACSRYPKIFPKIFVYMIRAGELGGNLDEIMYRIAAHYERENQLREKTKSALTYPLIVAVVSAAAVIFLLTNVIPPLVGTLQASGSEIPLPTQIVLAASNLVASFWYVFPLAAAGIILLWIMIRRHAAFRYHLDRIKLNLPVFGALTQKSAISRMARTLSALLASAVPVLQSISVAAEIVNNEVMVKALHESRESLRKGESLSAPLEKHKVFPPLVAHMIRVGEESGQLESMLEKVAEFYEEDVVQMTSRLNALLEPLMILILAVIVGTIVLSVLLPMFQIYQNV